MKDELKGKHVPSSFSDCFMDKWHQYTQDNKSAKEYVTKFNEFLIKCSTFSKEGQAQIFSRFRVRFREELRIELLVRGVTKLKKVYTIDQDLDSLRSNYNIRSFNSKSSVSRISSSSQFNKSAPNPTFKRTTSKKNEVMIVAKPLSKLLPNLFLPLSVIDVKVTVKTPLTVLAK